MTAVTPTLASSETTTATNILLYVYFWLHHVNNTRHVRSEEGMNGREKRVAPGEFDKGLAPGLQVL